MRVLMMANNNSETPVAETAQYPSCNFNESMPNYLADNLSVYLGPCEPVPDPEPEPECVPDPEPEHVPDCEPEPCNNVGKPNICNIDALVDPLDSNVLTVLCDLKDTCGKGTANKIDDVKRSSNRRNRRKSSSNQKKNTKLAARKNRRSSGKRPMVDLFAADFGKGQRSNLVRRARLSVWGFGGKIDEIFKQNAENKADIKGRTVRTDSANKSILISKGEFRASNKGLLVKLKLGSMGIQNCQLNTIPDMDKDLESYREVKLEPSNLQSDVKEIVSLKSRIAEKEGIENRCLDPGTSPDSEVINVIPDTQINGTSTTEEIRVSSKDCISLQSDDCGIHSPEIVNDASLCEKQTERSPPSMSMASFHQTEVSVSMDMLTVESVIKAGIESMESQFNGQHFQINLKSNSSVNKNRANCSMENNGKNKTYGDTETHPVSGNLKTNDAKALEEGSRSTSGPLSNSTMVPHSAWVCCDDCHKWRRIPTVLADSIESTKCRWICKDNMDKEFADCSIPQEKSNADINEELELSEASCEEDACNNNTRLNSSHLAQKQPTDPPQLSWKLIKTNLFLHRNRKNQPIDEVMVCHCKPPIDGRMGCRDECLNRMLNIECVKGTCPCGDFCSNQQFQKRKYSKLKCVPSGKKGCGLQLQEDIPKGRFLIEYVGEVLDMPAYEARQKEYASKGHKHFYFMTLNGSEVIDACAKGNLGRFINHSCEPNCRTEKWMVNGEVCIGLFAIRDINKGEELTFDYNYVRVFGAAAKKCICGSSRCRGVIGGDPLNDETVVLDDSDDEYSEPVPFNKENNNNLDNSVSITVTTEETNLINDLETNQNVDSATLLEVSSATSASESKVEYTEGLLPSFVQPVDTCIKVKTEIKKQSENTTSVSLLSEDGDCKKKSKSHSNDKKCTILKPKFYSKINSSPSATKKGKSKSKQIEIDTKPPQKPKKIVVDNLTGRFEAVEEALNILLTNGGISKRRDAWKGYLTLLGLTALGGNGEGIQSNRDLSMILDALLRTKSRTVLVDIINKNGLQMLHILLKRYRKVFNKTPILRKLLKVLEYLAETKILTVDKILKSSQLGVESFKESILSLTEHADKEVHHIARNFRDRYIPWSARRVIRAEWDIDRMEYQQKSNLTNFPSQQLRPSEIPDNTIKQSISPVELPSASCVSSSTGVTRIRKRKSRWDQPGDVGPVKKEHQTKGSDPMDVDAPPGFSFSPPSTATDQCKTVTGRPQDRYVSRLPTAFGLPCSLFKNLGIQARDGEGGDGWIVAPGLTFHPFPPLPSYVKEEESWRNRNFQRDRNINTLGKRYFKQQKWNYSRSGGGQQWNHPSKYGPVGFNGPNRDRPNMGVGYGGNEGNGTYNTGNNYYQQQQ